MRCATRPRTRDVAVPSNCPVRTVCELEARRICASRICEVGAEYVESGVARWGRGGGGEWT